MIVLFFRFIPVYILTIQVGTNDLGFQKLHLPLPSVQPALILTQFRIRIWGEDWRKCIPEDSDRATFLFRK